MLKLLMLCVLGLAVGQQDGNTRFFGGGGGLLGGGQGGLLGGGHGGLHGGGHGGLHGGGQAQGATCRYWCKTPENQNYCCESGAQPPSPVGRKPGTCPIVRIECPPVRAFSGGPQTCSNDYSCSGSDKCCYDSCLREHVCKPAEYAPIPFGRR